MPGHRSVRTGGQVLKVVFLDHIAAFFVIAGSVLVLRRFLISVPMGGADDDRVAALDGVAGRKVGVEKVEEEEVEEVVEEVEEAGGPEPPEEEHGGGDCQRRCHILRVYRYTKVRKRVYNLYLDSGSEFPG